MNLSDINVLKSILTRYGIRPNKYLGQHFLADREVLEEILAAAEISQKDLILEIGPGLGVLTLELAKRAKKVVAVEKDPNLTRILNNELRINNIKNVKIIEGDILKISNFCPFGTSPAGRQFLSFRDISRSETISKKIQNSKFIIHNSYKIVANLPYYLTARVIRKFLELDNPPNEMTLMIQKEVARRICAQPPEMNLLAVSVQFYADPEIAAFVPKKSFWPEPEVDSAVIKIKIKNEKRKVEADAFFKIVRAGFSSPRKKLANNLTNILAGTTRKETEKLLKKIGLRPDCRSQDLSVDNWRELVSLLRKNIV